MPHAHETRIRRELWSWFSGQRLGDKGVFPAWKKAMYRINRYRGGVYDKKKGWFGEAQKFPQMSDEPVVLIPLRAVGLAVELMGR